MQSQKITCRQYICTLSIMSLTYNKILYAHQSLACKTTINTDFSVLFSLKRIYVKYKNAILSLIDSFFRI